ncbi:MAG: pantoate--beta-alanine ligase, partial [Burkholderiaceae bacterium]|nr:pantoate--beta-alanine ligase [Burkholderiaceae bacterium]
SSRNGYLDAGERAEAPALHRALLALVERARAIAAGLAESRPQDEAVRRELRDAEEEALDGLRARGWAPDYLVVRRREDLGPPGSDDLLRAEALVALGAARLGATRLIDNVEF